MGVYGNQKNKQPGMGNPHSGGSRKIVGAKNSGSAGSSRAPGKSGVNK